jgi:hypothetical protein
MQSRSERARLAVPVGEQDHVLGLAASAEVTLVEYGDFECPYTRRSRAVVRRLRQEFGDRLLFVFSNFPLSRIHPHAQAAAEAAEAAGAQGRYWEMHDLLFDNQRHLEHEDLRRYAQRLGFDPERFDRELAQHVYARRVREDLRGGLKSGVRRTPTFFVNGLRHEGPNDLATLWPAVDEALCMMPPLGARGELGRYELYRHRNADVMTTKNWHGYYEAGVPRMATTRVALCLPRWGTLGAGWCLPQGRLRGRFDKVGS